MTEFGLSHGILPKWLINRLISNPKGFETQIGVGIKIFLEEFFMLQDLLLGVEPLEGVWKITAANPKLFLNGRSYLFLQRLHRPYFDHKHLVWGEEAFEIRNFSSAKTKNKREYVFTLTDFEYVFGQFLRFNDPSRQVTGDSTQSAFEELSGARLLVDRQLLSQCESDGEVLVLLTTTQKAQQLSLRQSPDATKHGFCALNLSELLSSSHYVSDRLNVSRASIVDDLKLLLKVGRSINLRQFDEVFQGSAHSNSSWDIGFSVPGSAIPTVSWWGMDQTKAFEECKLADTRFFRLHRRAYTQLHLDAELPHATENRPTGVLKLCESIFVYVDQLELLLKKMQASQPEEFKNRFGNFYAEIRSSFEESNPQGDVGLFLDLLNSNVDIRKQVTEVLNSGFVNKFRNDPKNPSKDDLKTSMATSTAAKDLIGLSEKESIKTEKTDSKLLRMAENELQDLFERDRQGYLELKRKYIESLNPSQKSMLLEVEKRLRPKVFEDQIRFRLVRYMVDAPDNWRSARSLVQ